MNQNKSFIKKINNAYSKESCVKLINWFEKNKHKAKKGLTAGKNLDNLEICIEVRKEKNFFNLGKTLKKCIVNFKKTYPEIDTHLCRWDLDPYIQLMKYEPGQFYDRLHCENDGTPAVSRRVFAWMIYLNTIKKGGGTKFIYQNKILKPVAGDFYIWPAYWTHFHKGVVAPKEEKFLLTGWINYVH
jgi:hypothetical protein